VRCADAGVQDVRSHAGARGVVRVRGAQRQVTLVDPVQTPRRVRLRGVDGHFAVLFNILHTQVAAQSLGLFFIHLDGISVDGVFEHLVDTAAVGQL
jgi:uncharacterized ferritin-like protein (DUF455 family)